MSYQYQPQPTYYQPQQTQYYGGEETQAERVPRLHGQAHLVFAAILSMAATVLLFAFADVFDVASTLTTFSSPFIPSIHFLHSEGRTYGAFGYCPTWDLTKPKECWGPVLGYDWKPWIPGGWLVKIMILYGIATLALLPAFISHHSATHMRTHGTVFRLFAIPAALTSLIAFAFSTYLFGKALNDFNNSGVPRTRFGPALWISLAGTISAVLSLLVGGPRDAGVVYADASNVATVGKHGRFKRAHPRHVYEI